MKPALLLVDLQRYYLEVGPDEKLAAVGTLVAHINDLVRFCRGQAFPVVWIRTEHKADGSTWNQQMRPHWTGEPQVGTLTEGTREAGYHPDLLRSENDSEIVKTRGSAFVRTDLEAVLGELGVDTVIIAGFSTNRCVGLTAIDAWERDFRVILAGDAVLGTNVEDGKLMLDYLRKAFGVEPDTNAGIKELLLGYGAKNG